MTKSSDISEEDMALFRDAVSDVTPIKKQPLLHETKKPSPMPKQKEADEQSVMRELTDNVVDRFDLEMGDELLFLRPGMQKQTLRKLRKGQYPIESELDLHGMTVSMAKDALGDYLNHCRQSNKRCVRIIHGKGLGSKDKKPVIKNKLNIWLPRIDNVLAYCSARQVDGGTGAIYVLLKSG
ncbi:MAG: Smr/MutS family protein [Pseudomonadota bacterium]